MLHTPVSAIFDFAPNLDNTAVVMQHCILSNIYLFTLPEPPGELMTREKMIFIE